MRERVGGLLLSEDDVPVPAFDTARVHAGRAATFPSNSYDLSVDQGRQPFDIRHRFSLFAPLDLPGFSVVPFVTASSGQ